MNIKQLAERKALPEKFLRQVFRIEDHQWSGKPVVRIPWAKDAVRLLTDDGPRWERGVKAKGRLYGIHRLFRELPPGKTETPTVMLVEGESDAWTLTHLGWWALAYPGANMFDWYSKDALALAGWAREAQAHIYWVIENDTAGKNAYRRAKSADKPKIWQQLGVEAFNPGDIHNTCDVNDLWRKVGADPEAFDAMFGGKMLKLV